MNDIELYKAQTRCISHEIRNHLSICELYSEIIKKTLIKNDIHNDSIDNAIICIQKSLKIISNSLLDLKSLNNLCITRLNLKKVLEYAIEMSSAYFCGKNITIISKLDGNIFVNADENKFLACIVNIIKNAVEAIDTSGKIEIKTQVTKNKVHIFIINNGKAINQNKQDEIFKEGFTTKSTGSGLGLHICKNNLALQNAELRLNKSDEESTEFEIILPLSD